MSASIFISVLAAIGAAGAMSASQNALKDVQVGEEGRLMRIALVCEKGCDVQALPDNLFELANIESDLEIPLQGRSELVRALRFDPEGRGSVLSLIATRGLEHVAINKCAVKDAAATCIDLEFAEAPAEVVIAEPVEKVAVTEEAAAPVAAPAPSSKPTVPQTEISEPETKLAEVASSTPTPEPEQTAPAMRTEPSAQPTPRPTLREAPNSDILSFARFAAPERIAPPKLAVLRPVDPSEMAINSPSQAPKKILKPAFNLREQAKVILGKSLGVAECEGAQARLNKDAWALDAMIDVGFCKASANKLQEADELFARLLAYTPDNYQALVGRALIAAEAGEIGDARGYFQDALNSLPPIKDSDRIVEAMRDL